MKYIQILLLVFVGLISNKSFAQTTPQPSRPVSSSSSTSGPINATQITTGTLDNARLNPTVVTTTGTQTLSGKTLSAPAITGTISSTGTFIFNQGAQFGGTVTTGQFGASGTTNVGVNMVDITQSGTGRGLYVGRSTTGALRKLTYYPRRLSNSYLQSLTQ